jgi:hypothetical protein
MSRRKAQTAGVLPPSFPAEQAKPKLYRLEIPLELLCTGDAAGTAIDTRFMPQ